MKFTHQVIYGENHRFPEPEDVVSEKMVKATKNIKFSRLVDRRNINFHPKEFSILSQGRSPRDATELYDMNWIFITSQKNS